VSSGSAHHRTALAVVPVLAAALTACTAVLVPACSPAVPRDDVQITVMTQNLYVGTGVGEVFAATSEAELVAAGSRAWEALLATDFPTRAGALADEIEQARPDVVGLQEVTLWRDQPFSDIRRHTGPNAPHVVLDHLAVLTSALAAQGTPYTAVAVNTTDDFEVTRRDADGLTDLRITDRDALLVRSDRLDRVSNPRTGHYEAVRVLPSWPAPVDSPRGWATVDYRLGPRTTVRIVNTHLEVTGPRAGRIQERQADELLAMIRSSPYPVIAMGDFNSQPGDEYTDTYERLTSVLRDVWMAARPGDPGPTCCQEVRLANRVPQVDRRVDLLLTSGAWPVTRVARTGAEPFRSAPPPVWASDHAGVTARITVPD